MQNNTLIMAYNPETGTDTVVFIPMKQTGTVSQPKTRSTGKQNNQPQTPEIHRTCRKKSNDAKSPKTTKKTKDQILAYEILTTSSICTKTESVAENRIKDSMLKRRMQPMTSGQRHAVKQYLNKALIGMHGTTEDIDEAHFEMVVHYTPRTRQFNKPVPHNILTLPEYQQRTKEILRYGVPVKKDENVMRIYVVRKNYKTVWAYFEPVVR